MRQLGDPPAIDIAMASAVERLFRNRDFQVIDADGTTGGKDYLERIFSLIRGTGFTVAIFSHETRPTAMANIALELGFAAMCGKPLIIVKSPQAIAPSDLKRTDWIEYNARRRAAFERKVNQALDEVERLGNWEDDLLQASLAARSPNCAVALERAIKGFLLSGDTRFVAAAERVLDILQATDEGAVLGDLERLRNEVRTFIRQAHAVII
jgi:hypothetical protein